MTPSFTSQARPQHHRPGAHLRHTLGPAFPSLVPSGTATTDYHLRAGARLYWGPHDKNYIAVVVNLNASTELQICGSKTQLDTSQVHSKHPGTFLT